MWKSGKRKVPVLSPENIEVLSEVWSERFAGDEEEREEYEERRRVLYECIGLLKGRSRDALVGFYERGMACADIAKRQGTSVPAIHMLLKRVREKLFECVQTKLGLSA
jgi:RNA polymerase sigma factor (sigma-70 family)